MYSILLLFTVWMEEDTSTSTYVVYLLVPGLYIHTERLTERRPAVAGALSLGLNSRFSLTMERGVFH